MCYTQQDMNDKPNLQLYFKEFVKTDSSFRGIDKIKKLQIMSAICLFTNPETLKKPN